MNLKKSSHFGFLFEENSFRDIIWLLVVAISFRKTPFPYSWYSHLSIRKRNAGFFKFLRFEKRFRKPSFWWRSLWDYMPNRRYKAALSNFSGLVWTLSKVLQTHFVSFQFLLVQGKAIFLGPSYLHTLAFEHHAIQNYQHLLCRGRVSFTAEIWPSWNENSF